MILFNYIKSIKLCKLSIFLLFYFYTNFLNYMVVFSVYAKNSPSIQSNSIILS